MNLKQLRALAEKALDGDPLKRFEYFQQIEPRDTIALLDLVELQHMALQEYKTYAPRKEGHGVYEAIEAYDAFNKEQP